MEVLDEIMSETITVPAAAPLYITSTTNMASANLSSSIGEGMWDEPSLAGRTRNESATKLMKAKGVPIPFDDSRETQLSWIRLLLSLAGPLMFALAM